MANNNDKLIIEVKTSKQSGCIINISQKANALLDEIVKKSGNSKSSIASRLIEYAYEHVEYDNDSDAEE